MQETVLKYYRAKIIEAETEGKRYETLINRYSFLRLFALIAGGLLVYQSLKLELVWLTELAVLSVIVGFAWLVKQQSRFEKQKSFFAALKLVTENELASISSKSTIYSDGSRWINDHHEYTSDLDIFGDASLYKLINRSASPAGQELLAEWLKQAAADQDIAERQEAVKELASKPDWMQQFKALLLFAKDTGKEDTVNLFHYLSQEPEQRSKLLKTYVKAAPWLFLGGVVLTYFISAFAIFLIIVGITNGAIVVSHSMQVNKADRLISRLGKTLSNYADAFLVVEQESWTSPLTRSLRESLKGRQETVLLSQQLKKLSKLIGKLEARLNIFVGPVLNAIFAWDMKQLLAIEQWREENRSLLENAFQVIAGFESLVSLSSIHYNYPHWSFPTIATGEGYTYTATKLGHPLIEESTRVPNDFSLQNELKIDIITGSNMAGKSTFLRTVGINGVLALAGAPVCASAMEISNMRFFTYMRIRDSLNESISTFRAELNRIQLLLDVLQKGQKIYFLIDEMLRGTNSVDKYLGSKAIIERLISQKAVGIVATHDLQIAELEKKYPTYIRNFYFDIQVMDNEMTFDYKLKEGECKTFNASLLLKKLGIEIDASDA
ncbi:DNA mismatch repair protein MutS [Pedobacter sp. SYSU D00535]|uniref:MutS-related protein n=1 Tax=Pedobacter sp. SYSU D00535 TaxID=2810308 RepID=UPI001A966D0E|nr:DNA mismatch repair protein MutS [Pedobacter sp. SYSU D00535]